MPDRLTRRDLVFLAGETDATPMHNVTVEIFDPEVDGDAQGFDYDALIELIDDRISFVPRYRQRLATVPGRVSAPVWIDDSEFDLAYHVRRSALPRPGTIDQLRDLTARIVSRPLDRSHPLWEAYFVEGLEGGRVAVLTKSHQLLVDGSKTVDIGQVLLDVGRHKGPLAGTDEWAPRTEPSPAQLLAGAMREAVVKPTTVVDAGRTNMEAAARGITRISDQMLGLTSRLMGRRSVPDSPITGATSQQRRVMTLRTDLDVYRRVRAEHGGTINDVILATITGGLRGWLMTRAESMSGMREIRAMVPMSVIDDELEATSLGTQITGHLVSLPITEASPVVRLHQVSYAFKSHSDTGRAVGASRLSGIAGFAPTTFHALGSRLAATEANKNFHVTVTNVPGPQFPLFAAGAQMLETYPVPPLLPGHAIAIGVTSYDGRVYYGVTADRDLVPDADVLIDCLAESLDELAESASETRVRAPRGRLKPPNPFDRS